MIPFDVDEVYKIGGTSDANLMGWGTKVLANGHSAFLAADLMSTESDWETPNGFEDRIAAEVGEVDMLKAGHHGAESSNSVPFMAALHPGAIIQTGAASHSPDRLSFLVLHGNTKWFPMGNIWESLNVPALVCVFADDEIQYDGVAHAQWGHEYESETPRAWWFQAGRPAATTGWWDGPSGNRYYFDGSASALANQWAVIDGVTYHFDATGALDATASTLTGSGVAGSFAASAWRYVLLGAALTALAGAGVAIAGRAGGS